MEENRTEQNESFKELSSLAFRLISIEKKSSMEVKNLLLQKGMDESNVNSLIDNIVFHIKSKSEKAKKDMDYGFYLFSGGVIITGITYLMSDYMGLFVVTWGFIAYGAFVFFRGFINRK